MGVNSLPKTVTRQRRGCDLNPGSSAPESSTLTTRLPSHPVISSNVRFFTILLQAVRVVGLNQYSSLKSLPLPYTALCVKYYY